MIQIPSCEPDSPSKLRPWLRWLSVVAFLLLIAYLSNQTFAEQDLRPKIQEHEKIVSAVRELPAISFEYNRGTSTDNRKNPVNFIHFFVRKGAHLLIYCALGLTLVLALERTVRSWRSRVLMAGSVLLLVAVLDELNQSLLHGRSGMARDVLIDMSGFVLSALAFVLYGRIKSRNVAATFERKSA